MLYHTVYDDAGMGMHLLRNRRHKKSVLLRSRALDRRRK